jgi:hypothetical protein
MQTKEAVEFDLIDLGAVSVETKGDTNPVGGDGINQFRDPLGLSQD